MHRTILLLLITVAGGAAQQSGSAPTGNVVNGKKLFTKIGCFQCHGYAGQGGVAGARLVPVTSSVPSLIRYIRRPAGEMPAYTEKAVSDQELTDILAYLKSLPAPKAVKDIPLLNDMKNRQ
jgi:mono/diheme cytochrome c family protein